MSGQPVYLYVYDLSQGLAKAWSLQMLGVQIDAVYHTSIVLNSVEWYFGHGINRTSPPGTTHHGDPIKIIPLGDTYHSDEAVRKYIDSMRTEYSPERYDLFTRNCNNFTSDLSEFLVGHRIPDYITNLPAQVLETPFGAMLRPAIERQLRPITNAPLPQIQSQAPPAPPASQIQTPTSLESFTTVLHSSFQKAAILFFTSASCRPCYSISPAFIQLASETPEQKVTFIKIDISTDSGKEIAHQFNIGGVTPTFITFSNGSQLDRWTGASEADLKSYFSMLLNSTFPAHPHHAIPIPTVLKTSMVPVLYAKPAKIDNILPLISNIALDPAISSLITYLQLHQTKGTHEAPIPDLGKIAAGLRQHFQTTPQDALWPLVDLFRAGLSDPRISGWFAEWEAEHTTIVALLELVKEDSPYQLRLVTLHCACNLFSTTLFLPHLVTQPLLRLIINLITSSLLSSKASERITASGLSFNLAMYVQNIRAQKMKEVVGQEELLELVASWVEAVEKEKESLEVVQMLVLALALGVYSVRKGGEVGGYLGAVEAGRTVGGKWKQEGGWKKEEVKKLRGLCEEVGRVLAVDISEE